MLFQNRHPLIIVVFLLSSLILSLSLITKGNIVFASDLIVVTDITEPLTSIPSYHASLTYAEYAGLIESFSIPSYHASLTYAEYAGLIESSSIPSYHASLTYAEYAGLIESSSIPSYHASLTYAEYAGLTEALRSTD